MQSDTINIIGATLDLQEKVVRQAMTPVSKTFMLDINSKLDIPTMQQIASTGHSRVPLYEEVEVPVVPKIPVLLKSGAATIEKSASSTAAPLPARMEKVKKIVGVLLVKQLLLLDPKDATPLRSIPINPIPCVPSNEPLLNILDKFQEGRSHMAIVSRFSVAKAKSVQHEVKKGLTQRLKERVIGDSSSSESSSDDSGDETGPPSASGASDPTLRGDGPEVVKKKRKWGRKGGKKRKGSKDTKHGGDVEKGDSAQEKDRQSAGALQTGLAKAFSIGREQSLPDDAVLGDDEADEVS